MRRLTLLLLFVAGITTNALAQHEIKNIIFLIGDGMGLSAVSMMQLENNYEPTIFDRAENIALQKTYSLDNRVTDSAASGTALATGSKTNNTMLGESPDGEDLVSLMDIAHQRGMQTGLIATTYLQHATPGAFYACTESRHNYLTITEQLVASTIDVAIGGGMAFFEEQYGSKEAAEKCLNKAGYELIEDMEALKATKGKKRVMALLGAKEVGENSGSYLAEATAEAIRLFEKRGDKGFALMVEGSLIDGMGHGNDAKAQQKEMDSFMQAVEVAVEYAEKSGNTLVVVTADHETGGLSIVSGNADFNLSEQGIEYRWTTDGHSGQMVPIYLYGAGAERINGIMENAELGAKLKALISE
ncbi:MAG: alkaline phosphatase [Alistipes sp.]|nr:alkaline phosphatase [Alistipes sp.]